MGSLEATRTSSTAVHDALADAVIGDFDGVQVASEGHLPSGHSVHVGDVVAVEMDGKHAVGKLWLLATLTDIHGDESDVACGSNWPRTGGTQYCRDFEINDESSTYVPLCAVRSSLIYCMNAQKTLASCTIPLPLRTCRFAERCIRNPLLCEPDAFKYLGASERNDAFGHTHTNHKRDHHVIY